MIKQTNRAIFLDRDGIINRAIIIRGKPFPPSSMEELEILPGVLNALKELKTMGFLNIVVTNQPDVARGVQRREIVEEIHAALINQLPLDDIMVCYHDDSDNCHCRKPLSGLLLMAAELYDIDLATSFMVGDRWRDIEAGKNAGCQTILIDYNYEEKKPATSPNFIAHTLAEASKWIIKQSLR